ncbi:MAG: hypothetical protein K2N95_13575 [Lachnospiraceae bacterium]|nr:hypothetical protein [Lachnospiraceae bacterium]
MAKKLKKGVFVILAAAILYFLYSCIYFQRNKPDLLQAEEYGSFTPDDVESFDGKFIAKQEVEKLAGVKYVRVYIYDIESGGLAGDFFAERAWDFWGICWEKDNYNIWIQSADVGIYCYRYEDGNWTRDEHARRPEYIVSRWEAKEAAKE